MHTVFLLIPENPMVILLIVGVIVLLFGSAKLPQLAKSLGQSKRAFKEGMDEAEAAEERDRAKAAMTAGQPAQPALSAVNDEALFEEARRRAAALRATENTGGQIKSDNAAPGQIR
jgi:sec-independent protein translocase protein TatA